MLHLGAWQEKHLASFVASLRRSFIKVWISSSRNEVSLKDFFCLFESLLNLAFRFFNFFWTLEIRSERNSDLLEDDLPFLRRAPSLMLAIRVFSSFY